MKTYSIVEKYILLLLTLLIFVMYAAEAYNIKLLGYITLFIDIYALFKYRKNAIVFLTSTCFLIFDYSVIISKYISYTPDMISVFKHFMSNMHLMYIGIASLLLFHITFIFFCDIADKNINLNKIKEDNKKSYYEAISIAITLVTAFIIIDYYGLNLIIKSRTIYEYTIILFILACYYSKKKLSKSMIFIVMMISFIANSIEGGRVLSLQPLIAYLLFFYKDKLNNKRILTITISGVILFTFLGIYGDILVTTKNFNSFSIKYVLDIFLSRKFAIDTAISSFGSSLTFLSLIGHYSIAFRIKNFIHFITTYTLLGSSAKYTVLGDLSIHYYTHYYGAYLPHCFYFWLGWIGPILIGYITAKYANISVNINSSGLKYVMLIYFVSTLPRWYLYYPTSLFRGMLLLVILYIIISFFIKDDKRNEEIK